MRRQHFGRAIGHASIHVELGRKAHQEEHPEDERTDLACGAPGQGDEQERGQRQRDFVMDHRGAGLREAVEAARILVTGDAARTAHSAGSAGPAPRG